VFIFVFLLNCYFLHLGKFNVNEELSELFNKLWDLDENRCEPGEHYRLNKGGLTTLNIFKIKIVFFIILKAVFSYKIQGRNII